VEFLSIDAITVAQQIARRGVSRESLKKLPGSPFCREIRGHSKMDRTPTVVRQNHKDKQEPECDCRNYEKVVRDHVLHVVLQKCAPRLPMWLPGPDNVLRDCYLRDRNTKFHQFAVNARSSPTRIGQTHSPDEIPDFTRYRRAAYGMAALPFPVQLESLPMTVSGLKIINADRQFVHNLDNQTHNGR
jgi:hypothetical protein